MCSCKKKIQKPVLIFFPVGKESQTWVQTSKRSEKKSRVDFVLLYEELKFRIRSYQPQEQETKCSPESSIENNNLPRKSTRVVIHLEEIRYAKVNDAEL